MHFLLSARYTVNEDTWMKKKTQLFWGFITAVAVLAVMSMLLLPRLSTPPPGEAPLRPSFPDTSQQPRPPSDPFSAIDRALESMELGNIAFNAPLSMNLQDTATIQLMLGLTNEIDELKQMIDAEGDKEGVRIRVSDRMEARLSGQSFSITAITPETQAVSRRELTSWKWEVKPISEGDQYLHLTLSAIITVDNTAKLRAIRTFDKVIEVNVTWPQRIGSFFEDNWQWLWAAILAPIAGWSWKRRKGGRGHDSRSDG